MSKQIDRTGTFLGTVAESTLGQSSNGFPQWVARLAPDKRYINDAAEMAHYGITEPGYVDWNFDESILAYLVLFTDKGPLKNYEQLMTATGWTGEDFQDLTNLTGKRVLFRVEENTFKDKVSLQVNWIDAEDAPPERTLKSVAPDKISELNAKFLAGMKKPVAPPKPAVAAKPAAAAPKPLAAPAAPATVTAPKVDAPSAEPAPSAPAAATASPATVAPSAAPSKAPRAKKAPVPPVAQQAPDTGLPAATTKDAAWDFLNDPAQIGDKDPAAVADAWIAACSAVGPDIDEDKFSGEMWAAVRDKTLAAMKG